MEVNGSPSFRKPGLPYSYIMKNYVRLATAFIKICSKKITHFILYLVACTLFVFVTLDQT